jgi:hypothetical protein
LAQHLLASLLVGLAKASLTENFEWAEHRVVGSCRPPKPQRYAEQSASNNDKCKSDQHDAKLVA